MVHATQRPIKAYELIRGQKAKLLCKNRQQGDKFAMFTKNADLQQPANTQRQICLRKIASFLKWTVSFTDSFSLTFHLGLALSGSGLRIGYGSGSKSGLSSVYPGLGNQCLFFRSGWSKSVGVWPVAVVRSSTVWTRRMSAARFSTNLCFGSQILYKGYKGYIQVKR